MISLDQISKVSKSKPLPVLPSWASDKNVSKSAYLLVLKLRSERILFIDRQVRASDLVAKKSYSITSQEVSSLIPCAYQTLVQSPFSPNYKDFLREVNSELLYLRNLRINSFKSKSGGVHAIPRKKLNSDFKLLKIDNDRLKKKLAVDALDAILSKLPLDVAVYLGLNK